MSEEIKRYDENNNLIYRKYPNNFEYKYNENNKMIYQKNSNGYEIWYKYDKKNRAIMITEKEYNEIEYLSREKVSRFELMDI